MWKQTQGVLNFYPQTEATSSPVAPVPPSSVNVLNPSDGAYKFQVDGGTNSTNFL